jgi:hypothetical protein
MLSMHLIMISQPMYISFCSFVWLVNCLNIKVRSSEIHIYLDKNSSPKSEAKDAAIRCQFQSLSIVFLSARSDTKLQRVCQNFVF